MRASAPCNASGTAKTANSKRNGQKRINQNGMTKRNEKKKSEKQKARTDADLRIFWLPDLGSNQGPTD
jgi:hypothetical protein